MSQSPDASVKSSYSIAYSGNNLWNPGAAFAYDRVLNQKDFSSDRKSHTREILLRVNTGFYLDPGSHGALYGNSGIGFRKAGKKFSYTFYLSPLGLYRSFLTETYEVEERGVSRVFLPGNLYFAPSAGIDFGRSLNRDEGNEVFFGIQMISLFPYNIYVMPVINIRLGYRFSPKGGER